MDERAQTITALPPVRGTLTAGRPMAELTWLRVGGPADWLFQPADEADLAAFLAALPPAVPVFPMGVGSNLIVRDGGIAGVVVRLGRGFNGIRVEHGPRGRGRRRARRPRRAPGGRGGRRPHLPAHDPGLDRRRGADERRLLRHLHRRRLRLGAGGDAGGRARRARARRHGLRLPLDGAARGARHHRGHARGAAGRPGGAGARGWRSRLARRDASQPIKERSAGSTFRNPAGFSSTGRDDDVHDLKAWKLIEDAGMKGATLGGAQMSPMHANFLINTGGAKAADLENLGELVRKKVLDSTGITLEWEIMRVGRPARVTE